MNLFEEATAILKELDPNAIPSKKVVGQFEK
jgi:hypothetical protein